ncbi:carbohydrate ABC transporter substrate-binding protein (CUT1 family) [Hydrogenispora ethanolica]|uniref:Carbohydrate ABC transporter substrate-binding protein (CUT1 family) n=1 Tax=Hydrogenispora ethanolica TaxID=1082276 RepID=A0A4R1S9N7_HYDET|nr:sugar ABC transporter substrate-binding protein [Hydrogenispora ethanolica]TCL75242.1 carbohydrate ABC transporter substrate-binding protein (CUT1 family) [Hydrogenispora ethanolica]
MKRFLLVLCLVVALVGIPAFAETKTINFLEVMTSPERTAMLKGMIDEYESSHPGVKVNLISPPYEQADQKATLMLNSNQPLDIIEVRDNTIKQFVNNKKLTNLAKYYRSWKEAKTLTPVSVAAAKTVDNTPYIIPQCIFIKALFVRKDILEKNGVTTLPNTIAELINTCIKITNPAKNQYGFAWRGKSSEMKFSDYFASAYVKDIKKDAVLYSEEKNYFTDPRYVQGMKAYVELFKKGAPQDAINWGFNEQINGFVSGITPFLIQDPDAIPLIDKMLDPEKYVVIPVPVGPTGMAYLDYGFTGLGIPSYSKNAAQAWDFIKWMSSAEKNAYFCEHYGALPVQSTAFKTNKYFQGKHYQAFLKEMTTPSKYVFKPFPQSSPKWPGWGSIHEADMQSVLLGQAKLETVLAKWKDYWTK